MLYVLESLCEYTAFAKIFLVDESMRILFLTGEILKKTGGGMIMRSHRAVLEHFAGKDNVYTFIFPNQGLKRYETFNVKVSNVHLSVIQKMTNVMLRWDPSINAEIECEIEQIVKRSKIDIIYLGRSTQGYLIKLLKLKFPHIPIIAFYHDIFSDVLRLRKKENIKDYCIRYLIYRRWFQSELYCSQHADANIVLNLRDAKAFKKSYKKDPDLVLPIICEDKFVKSNIEKKNNTDKFNLYFIGSYFAPNINGITWFAKNVMPNLPDGIILKIVGNKMEQLKANQVFLQNNIEIIGTVESLTPYYEDADIVIAPIFEGTGMKTKTAEALMYGKCFLGTQEALCGYDEMDEFSCNNADEFIEQIKKRYINRPDRYNDAMRQIYVRNYSIEAVSNNMEKLFKRLIDRNYCERSAAK